MTFLIVNMHGRVAIECNTLDNADRLMKGRGLEWFAIQSDLTIYHSPLTSAQLFDGVARIAACRKNYDVLTKIMSFRA